MLGLVLALILNKKLYKKFVFKLYFHKIEKCYRSVHKNALK